jgi:predicted neutral ceramidase superfamily lipid hydrolase
MQSRRTFTYASRVFAAFALLSLIAVPALRAQQTTPDAHLVSPDQLQQQVQKTSATRQANIENLIRFLSTPAAEKAMHDAKVEPVQLRTAIPTLSDQELANLSQRATQAQGDFAAGTISNNTLLIIILVLVAVILIAVIR